MKKLILFFVLILGFVSGIKAQFPASSEIYYYLLVANEGGSSTGLVVAVKFYDNGMRKVWLGYHYEVSNQSINDKVNSIDEFYLCQYDSENSTSKYICYFKGKAERGPARGWHFISKDKNEMIDVDVIADGSIIKRYYKRITKEELINGNKPNFDFLE